MTTHRRPWLAPDHPEVVWFRGSDAVRFLNDLLSQEVASLEPGQVRRSLLLQPQGKLDQILWVLRGDDEIALVAEQGRGEELASTLGRYRIRVDVEIARDATPTWILVEPGPDSGNVEANRWSMTDSGLFADVSWTRTRRTLVVGPRPSGSDGDEAEYELLRILSGEPRWGVDVDEKTIPQEAGVVDAGVDFTKGCFLGQELVARIDSRGHVNRHLRILEFEEPRSRAESVITAGGSVVGAVTSLSGSFGLGFVRREVSVGDNVEVDGGNATIRDLPSKSQT